MTEVQCDGIDNDCNAATPDDLDPTDADGDNYTRGCGQDCNDTNIAVNPGATETTCDGVDNDCNAGTPDDSNPADSDGDTYTVGCGNDCNDGNPAIHPGANEVTCDGVDNDCNPLTQDDSDPTDADGDFYTRGCGQDCNDTNPNVHPGAAEIQCDGLDNDCNAGTVDDPNPTDGDGDNWTIGCGDCNDFNPAIHPGVAELQCDGVDNDCSAATPDDSNPQDGDGDTYSVGCGADCNDNDGDINPGHSEVCDDKDNDCDGRTDRDDFGGICGLGEACELSLPADQEHCSGDLYCQHNNVDSRNLCVHWCNNSHEVPGDTDGVHECPPGYKCELYSNTDSSGFCWPVQSGNGGKDVGAACGGDSECRSEWCISNYCSSGCSSRTGCQHVSNWSCVLNSISSANGNMDHGLCMQAPGTLNTGGVCYSDLDCVDGFCDFYAGSYGECENFCCTVDACPPAYYCSLWTRGTESSIFKACDWGARGTGAFGDSCTTDSDCASRVCLGNQCNSFCCRNGDCPGGYKCDFAFSIDMSPYAAAQGRACVPE